MNMRSGHLIIFILVFCHASAVIFGQKPQTPDIVSAIPEGERPQFSQSFNIYLAHHRAKDWASVYDMQPRVHTQHPEITKEQFLADIKRYGKRRVIQFIPERIATNDSVDGQYEIFGCAKVKTGLFTSKWQASIYASIENKKWVFSDILFVMELEARDPRPCTH